MSEFRTLGFHHISLVSSDAARTTQFYRDVLGFRLLSRDGLHFGLGTAAPGTLVSFFERPDAPRGRWGLGGIHHLALGVSTREAQLKWKRRLQDHGAHVAGPYDRGWFHSIYFTDPDGQVLEIATQGPGYALDEPADRLGERVITPSPERIIGHRDERRIAALTHGEPVPEITAEMVLDGIHHITGMTGDVAELGEFYERTLGLRLVKRTVNQDDGRTPHWFWARYDGAVVAPHSALTMFGTWARGGITSPRYRDVQPGTGQTDHVAFRARDDEELGTLRESLLSAGVSVSPVLDHTFFRSIQFRAPDGLLLEVSTDTPGFTSGENP